MVFLKAARWQYRKDSIGIYLTMFIGKANTVHPACMVYWFIISQNLLELRIFR